MTSTRSSKRSEAPSIFNEINLVGLDRVHPAEYNPRVLDRERLELIKLSLSKLGFLLPIYATPSGELLSGHQRSLAAKEIGFNEIPVVFVDSDKEKNINIIFNRGTNDLKKSQSSRMAYAELLNETIQALQSLPDLQGSDRYPCLSTKRVPCSKLLSANPISTTENAYPYRIAKLLYDAGVLMPVVVNEKLEVVNGVGRMILAARLRFDSLNAVVLDNHKAELARQCLNCLTMDFNLQEKYADLLRYNSFRRVFMKRKNLGRGFTFAVHGSKSAASFDLSIPSNKKKFLAVHGKRILDFGAGHLIETNILRSHGFFVTPFEPYRIRDGKDEIDKEASVALARQFLEEVEKGTEWDSIFISSVLNSVPFESDRLHIVRLTAALASKTTKLYAAALNYSKARAGVRTDFLPTNASDVSSSSFALDYEPGITLAELSQTPKVQKYHTVAEFQLLFRNCWEKTVCTTSASNVELIASCPKAVDPKLLRSAIEFEFNLPYPDGSRMGLVEEALRAYSVRLGIQL